MNILMLSPTFYPLFGGLPEQLNTLSKEMIRQGHNITVVTENIQNAPEKEVYNGIKVYRLPKSFIGLEPWGSYLFIRDNLRKIQEIASKEDTEIVNVHHANLSLTYAYLIKKNWDIPVVITTHMIWVKNEFYTSFRMRVSEPIRQLIKIIPGIYFEKRTFKDADGVIAISEYIRQVVESVRGPEGVYLVPDSINLEEVDATPKIKRSDLGLSEDKKYVLFMGRLANNHKGITTLLDAFKLLCKRRSDAELLILGEGPDQKMLEGHIAKEKIPGVTFNVVTSREKVYQYCMNSDLLVCPSNYEAFGLVNIEAMACRKPVIASNIDGIKDIVVEGETGFLVPPRQPRILFEKMSFILGNPDKAYEMGLKGRRRVEEKFDVKSVCKKTIDVFEQLVK